MKIIVKSMQDRHTVCFHEPAEWCVALNVAAARNCGTVIMSSPLVKDGPVYPMLEGDKKGSIEAPLLQHLEN